MRDQRRRMVVGRTVHTKSTNYHWSRRPFQRWIFYGSSMRLFAADCTGPGNLHFRVLCQNRPEPINRTSHRTLETSNNFINTMSHENGILISFEGSEGCGKSTQIRRLADRLEEIDHRDVVVTREPGGTVIGEDIRHLLMHAESSKKITPETELLLFAASRAQLVREIIFPAIQDGKIVLCDRFLDSTTVYQGVARQIADDPITQINAFAVGDVVPDLTVILDIPAEVGLERIKHRVSDMPDRMEQENVEFYGKVREGYLHLAKSLPDRFFVVDGLGEVDDIEILIWNEIHSRFFSED